MRTTSEAKMRRYTTDRCLGGVGGEQACGLT